MDDAFKTYVNTYNLAAKHPFDAAASVRTTDHPVAAAIGVESAWLAMPFNLRARVFARTPVSPDDVMAHTTATTKKDLLALMHSSVDFKSTMENPVNDEDAPGLYKKYSKTLGEAVDRSLKTFPADQRTALANACLEELRDVYQSHPSLQTGTKWSDKLQTYKSWQVEHWVKGLDDKIDVLLKHGGDPEILLKTSNFRPEIAADETGTKHHEGEKQPHPFKLMLNKDIQTTEHFGSSVWPARMDGDFAWQNREPGADLYAIADKAIILARNPHVAKDDPAMAQRLLDGMFNNNNISKARIYPEILYPREMLELMAKGADLRQALTRKDYFDGTNLPYETRIQANVEVASPRLINENKTVQHIMGVDVALENPLSVALAADLLPMPFPVKWGYHVEPTTPGTDYFDRMAKAGGLVGANVPELYLVASLSAEPEKNMKMLDDYGFSIQTTDKEKLNAAHLLLAANVNLEDNLDVRTPLLRQANLDNKSEIELLYKRFSDHGLDLNTPNPKGLSPQQYLDKVVIKEPLKRPDLYINTEKAQKAAFETPPAPSLTY